MKTLLPNADQAPPSSAGGQPAAGNPGSPKPETPAGDAPAADAGQGAGDGKGPGTEDKKPAGAGDPAREPAKPVTYDLKLPEKAVVDGKPVFDATHVDTFRTLVTELKLEPAAAQRLLEHSADSVKGYADALVANHVRTAEGWLDEVMADKALGGDNFKVTQANAQRFLNHNGDPAFTELLTKHGFINNPVVVRMLNRYGALLAEPKGLVPGGPAPQETSVTPAVALYGDQAARK